MKHQKHARFAPVTLYRINQEPLRGNTDKRTWSLFRAASPDSNSCVCVQQQWWRIGAADWTVRSQQYHTCLNWLCNGWFKYTPTPQHNLSQQLCPLYCWLNISLTCRPQKNQLTECVLFTCNPDGLLLDTALNYLDSIQGTCNSFFLTMVSPYYLSKSCHSHTSSSVRPLGQCSRLRLKTELGPKKRVPLHV